MIINNQSKTTSSAESELSKHAPETEAGQDVEGDMMTSDNVRIHYWFYNRGTKVATVFLHGGPGHSSEDFRTLQAKDYADTFGSLLVFDQRGCGQSQHSADMATSMTYDRAIKDINELRAYVIPENDIVIFGRSFGGLLAAHYASSNPERVLGYILVAPGEFQHSLYEEGSKQLNDASLAETDQLGQSSMGKAIQEERARVAAINHQTTTATTDAESVVGEGEEDISDQEIHDLTAAYQANESMLTRNDYPLLSSTADLPVLVMSGEYDAVVPPLAIDAMKPYLPDAIFLQLAKGWHFAAYAQENIFFTAVKVFFESLSLE